MTFNSDLERLILALNEASLDPQSIPMALGSIAKEIGAEHVNLWIRSPDESRSAHDWDGIEPAYIDSYERYYNQLDPIVPLTSSWMPGTLFTDQMLVSATVLSRSEFYQDWVRPQGIGGIALANFMRDGDLVGLFGAPRASVRPYPQRSLEMISALLPHLRHAIRTLRTLGDLSIRARDYANALNALTQKIFIVDENARVRHCNQTAELLLSTHSGLHIDHHVLTTPTLSSTRALHRLIAQATCTDRQQQRGGAMLIDCVSPGCTIRILVTPINSDATIESGLSFAPRTALIVVAESENRHANAHQYLQSLFGLTHGEARVACEIGRGSTPKEVAQTLGVMPSTVRTHLHQIYSKMGVRRQSDLVRIVTQLGTVAEREMSREGMHAERHPK
ncbi:helix-turn-helix transcriptional regulator [Paraburkholderia sp. CNPSo 3272]|uniref:helix-turn-helix transcriptional regulator n=1 Tax=Paraburkholderia sp. CNPSo 3272 TaxID=2940931 RepID=UPI0020B897D7|nr:helix-turn-helix transcriptional regulator [Paraburkholderia sp. CNPSo 3272]MCP3728381.1 helix-turn-helix transcriptional regulator [Paraburkholderia sp. CNPSo 3272]